MTDAFPSALVGPSSKERKYDRQLRLWAASGQQALEQSRILLVNSDGPVTNDGLPIGGVVGVEALKNLVLPGVGGFTIVDPANVTETDLGVNFFLEEISLGKSRADETCRLLQELNPDVNGRSENESISSLLRVPGFLLQFKLVIVSGPMKQDSLSAICHPAREYGIPVIYVRSVGFYSTFSLQLPPEFPIVETHPDPESVQDLRLLNPWPELKQAASRLDRLDGLDDHEHGHVPYILILLHYLEKWKDEHDGKLPDNYKEKTAFKEMVRGGARTNNTDGGEENYDEAVAAVMKSISPWSLRSNIREIFQMEQCQHPTANSDNFWIIASGIHTFYKKYNILPLPGSLPDMKAQSSDYVALQNIYKAKARQDVNEVVEYVRECERQIGSRSFPPVSEQEVERFCKNASHIKVIYGRDIPRLRNAAASLSPDISRKAIRSAFSDPESLLPIYIAFEALDLIIDGLESGKSDSTTITTSPTIANDSAWNVAIDQVLTTITEGDASVIDDKIRQSVVLASQELRRAEGGELHNISSLTGGLVAQEALKVITRQYIPMDNTCVFDGVVSRSEMYRL